ncbi:MAG: hypothetical protein AAF656_00445 [Planctomycetota bacterium]
MLTRDQIFAAVDMKREKVDTREWGGHVFVRTMSGTERDAFEREMLAAKEAGGNDLANIRARLAVRTVCDDKGKRVFTDADAEQLGRKSALVLDRIFETAQRLNGIGKKDVEELAGNSDGTPPAGSTSA